MSRNARALLALLLLVIGVLSFCVWAGQKKYEVAEERIQFYRLPFHRPTPQEVEHIYGPPSGKKRVKGGFDIWLYQSKGSGRPVAASDLAFIFGKEELIHVYELDIQEQRDAYTDWLEEQGG